MNLGDRANPQQRACVRLLPVALCRPALALDQGDRAADHDEDHAGRTGPRVTFAMDRRCLARGCRIAPLMSPVASPGSAVSARAVEPNTAARHRSKGEPP